MKILVSACLLGKNCKYNGGNNLNQSVLDFIEGHEVIDVCPEQLAAALENKVDLAILQSRSPSCGVKEIYDGSFSGKRIKGQGVFAKLLSAHGIKVLDAENVAEHR